MNAIAAALMGGFVGALIVSALNVLIDWRRAQRDAKESQEQRAHDLDVRILEHHHQMQRASLDDEVRLRDARLARLKEDAKELARALFDLERLALLIQWGQSSDSAEIERLETSARVRFESARAGLTLDSDGARLTATFESLTRDIAQYQSMLQGHRVLVEARAVQEVVDHADRMEAQRGQLVAGITSALHEIQSLLESIAIPVQGPAAPAQRSYVVSSEPVIPPMAASTELAASSPS